MNNETFVKEFQILWQNSSVEIRNKLSNIIRNYYDKGNRADKIINKMQNKIED